MAVHREGALYMCVFGVLARKVAASPLVGAVQVAEWGMVLAPAIARQNPQLVLGAAVSAGAVKPAATAATAVALAFAREQKGCRYWLG